MDWMKVYHEDHMAVMTLLAKLEGNAMYLQSGASTPNTYSEFKEFADIIEEVIIPHFKSEEGNIYKTVSDSSPEGKAFIDIMQQEHLTLYELFAEYTDAVERKHDVRLIDAVGQLTYLLKQHITKEETELKTFLQTG